MLSEPSNTNPETYSYAHAYVQISMTDGSFLEFGVNLKPACGTEDVEAALAECSTPKDRLACLLRFALGGAGDSSTGMAQSESTCLTDAEIADSWRLLRDALGDEAPDD